MKHAQIEIQGGGRAPRTAPSGGPVVWRQAAVHVRRANVNSANEDLNKTPLISSANKSRRRRIVGDAVSKLNLRPWGLKRREIAAKRYIYHLPARGKILAPFVFYGDNSISSGNLPGLGSFEYVIPRGRFKVRPPSRTECGER